MKSAEKIYSHFGFFGDLSIGLTIKDAKNRFLHLGKRRIEEHLCDNSTIYISRDLRYDELSNLNETIQSIFQELCRYFGATFENKIVVEIVEEIFETHKSLA